jgi:hypothetical protein
MTTSGATRQTAGLIGEADLYSLVAIAIDRAQLQHATGTRLNHGHRDRFSGIVKYLRHPDLSAEQANRHSLRLVVCRLREMRTRFANYPPGIQSMFLNTPCRQHWQRRSSRQRFDISLNAD